jgi:hydrogenase-4 component F
MQYGRVEYQGAGGFFYVDALSMLVLDIVLVIGLMVSIYSIAYQEEEWKQGNLTQEQLKLYDVLMYIFLFTMVLALTVKNMGLMWIAIEATTLASVFLVGFHGHKNALEAAWKYIIICSVGIAIALLGIILLHFASIGIVDSTNYLDWTVLFAKAKDLQGSVLRLAFIFILIGFGTKTGLAPMHTWLPDAHSQAPSPISALLSGVLLNSAMYGIIRTVAIVNRNQGSGLFTGRLLVGIGLLSIVTAAIFILSQKDYKRLLAYSSIEHMGIIAVAIGTFTPLSVFGGLLHMINHSLTKSMLFLSAGSVLQKYKTKQIFKIRGILKTLPFSGTAFLLGLFAIAGTPPFSVFGSELSILAALFEADQVITGIIIVLLLGTIFAGIAANLFKMFFGDPEQEEIQPGEVNIPGIVCILLILAAITVTGIYLPDRMIIFIRQVQAIILGR